MGYVYRMHVRSRFLRALAIPLDAGKPVPEALALIAESGYFSGLVRRRVARLRCAIEQGEPLAGALKGSGLLPEAMVPLVRTAERTHKLPWALSQLGDSLASRAIRLMQRFSLSLVPAGVVAVGLLVGFAAVGIFMPLVKIMSELSG
jgi:type IV pilus assembly protein PilC